MKRLLLIFLTVLVAAACREAHFPEDDGAVDEMVVEGWIDSGMPPIVFVSAPVKAVDNLQSATSLSDVNLRHARVSVECDGKTYPLTCRYSEAFFLRFYFTTNDLRGEVGKTYRLKVEYRDMVAEAVTTITQPKELEGIGVEPEEPGSDMYSIKASLHNNSGEELYYKFFVWNTNRDSSYASSYSETFSSEGREEDVCVTVKGGAHISGEETEYSFHKGDVVKVKLATMDSDAFDFWRNFDQNSTCLRFPVISVYRNCRGNVSGALGYWVGYGIKEYTVCVE